MNSLNRHVKSIIVCAVPILISAIIVVIAILSRDESVIYKCVLEAESAVLTDCQIINDRTDVGASNGECVGYLKVGSRISWSIRSEKKETVKMDIRLACPMEWVGIHNLPRTFDFDGLYTLMVNDEIIKTGARCFGSSDSKDDGNYYYWVDANVDVGIESGRSTITIIVSNTYGQNWGIGNLDCLTMYSGGLIEDFTGFDDVG